MTLRVATAKIRRFAWPLSALALAALCASKGSAAPCLDDHRLQQMMALPDSQRATLIYVWSPRMVYSVLNLGSAALAAEQAGLRFMAVHDGRIAPEELQQAVVAARTLEAAEPQGDAASAAHAAQRQRDALTRSRALCANALVEREALRHFPTAFLVLAAGIHAHPIVGAMPQSAWASSIAQRMKPAPVTP